MDIFEYSRCPCRCALLPPGSGQFTKMCSAKSSKMMKPRNSEASLSLHKSQGVECLERGLVALLLQIAVFVEHLGYTEHTWGGNAGTRKASHEPTFYAPTNNYMLGRWNRSKWGRTEGSWKSGEEHAGCRRQAHAPFFPASRKRIEQVTKITLPCI